MDAAARPGLRAPRLLLPALGPVRLVPGRDPELRPGVRARRRPGGVAPRGRALRPPAPPPGRSAGLPLGRRARVGTPSVRRGAAGAVRPRRPRRRGRPGRARPRGGHAAPHVARAHPHGLGPADRDDRARADPPGRLHRHPDRARVPERLRRAHRAGLGHRGAQGRRGLVAAGAGRVARRRPGPARAGARRGVRGGGLLPRPGRRGLPAPWHRPAGLPVDAQRPRAARLDPPLARHPAAPRRRLAAWGSSGPTSPRTACCPRARGCRPCACSRTRRRPPS